MKITFLLTLFVTLFSSSVKAQNFSHGLQSLYTLCQNQLGNTNITSSTQPGVQFSYERGWPSMWGIFWIQVDNDNIYAPDQYGSYRLVITEPNGEVTTFYFQVSEMSLNFVNPDDYHYCSGLGNPSVVGFLSQPSTMVQFNTTWFYYDPITNQTVGIQQYNNSMLHAPFMGDGIYTATINQNGTGCIETYQFSVIDDCTNSNCDSPPTGTGTDYFTNLPPSEIQFVGGTPIYQAKFQAGYNYIQLNYPQFHVKWTVTKVSTFPYVNVALYTSPYTPICHFLCTSGESYLIKLEVFDDSKCEHFTTEINWTAPYTLLRKSMAVDGEDDFQIKAYPNPSRGEFNITLPEIDNTIQVYNMSGSLVSEFRAVGNALLDLSSKENGIYLLRIINANGTEQIKLNVQK